MSKSANIVLVCGGRTYGVEPSHAGLTGHAIILNLRRAREEQDRLQHELNELHAQEKFTHLIHGDARGADRLAGEWAQEHGVQEVKCPAAWSMFGTKAGALRNHAMLELQPDLVIAFPGGTGTAHMVHSARTAGIPVVEVK